MLDHDRDGGRSFKNAAEFIAHIAIACPAIANAAYIARGSVSAGVFLAGTKPASGAGFHVYLPVRDARDIPRFGSVLFQRMMLAGLARIGFASDGKLLLRTAFDRCVFSPERLDFIAPPILKGAGLEYIPPEITQHSGNYLDTSSLLDLNADEQASYREILAQLKAEALPEQKQVEKAYLAEYKQSNPTATAEDLAFLKGKQTLPRSFMVVAETGEELSIQQLIENNEVVVIADPIEGMKYGRSTAQFYPNPGGKPIIKSFAHHGRVYKIADVNQMPASDTALKLAGAIEVKLQDYEAGFDLESCDVSADTIQQIISRSFWNPQRAHFYTITSGNILNQYSRDDAWGALTESWGALLNTKYVLSLFSDSTDKKINDVKKLIAGCQNTILNYLKRHSQRSSVSIETDMFGNEPRIEFDAERAKVLYVHEPWKISPSKRNDKIVADFKEHFSFFDDLLQFFVASRFASDRKTAFLWIKASSNFGKGLLAGVLAELGIIVDFTPKEVEACYEGRPVGKQAMDFKCAFALLFDEWKSVKSELKMLQSYITLAPKNQLSFRAPIYAKLFFSAEDVPSLVSCHGIETQFLTRFNHFDLEGRIDDRPLWKEVGKTRYKDALVYYVADFFNKSIAEYVAMGRDKAADTADDYLAVFFKKHGLHNFHKDLADGIDDMVREMAQHICDHSFEAGIVKTNKGLYLLHADRYVQDYVDTYYPHSSKVMIGQKRKGVIKKLSVDDKGQSAHRIPEQNAPVTRAVLIKPELYVDKNDNYTINPNLFPKV